MGATLGILMVWRLVLLVVVCKRDVKRCKKQIVQNNAILQVAGP